MEWKDIQNYEDLYQISNTGLVKSLERKIIIHGKEALLKERILKQDDNKGYKRVTLSKDGKTRRFLIHRLVAIHFLENLENKPMVNHIDNNPSNNNINNLEWVTHSENMIHAQKQNRLFNSQRTGGLKGSNTNKNKGINKANNDVGNIYKCYKILKVLPFIPNEKFKVKVQCINCNNEYIRTYSYVINNRNNNCINCRVKR